MTYVQQTYTGREGEGDFAFIFEVQETTYRIGCIALSLRCPAGEVNNITLSLLDDGQYELPTFEHPLWMTFDTIVNQAQDTFNFVSIKESLLVAYHAHFETIMADETAWLEQRIGEHQQAQEGMARAIETDDTLTFLKVFWDALRRTR